MLLRSKPTFPDGAAVRIAAVVAAQQNCYLLHGCLKNLREILREPSDLIFVDNGSKQNLSSWGLEYFPNITIIRLDVNRYFCGGYNAGIQVAMERNYDFVLIVNADTEVVNKDFLQGLLGAAVRWPRAAFVGPKVFWRTTGAIQKTCLQYPSVWEYSWMWIPWRVAGKKFELQPDSEREVPFLNGVCLLCRINALKEIGVMDKNMGGYVEDADWSWRAKEKGWSSVYTPIPSIIHHEATSGYEPYSLKTFLLKRNTCYWFLKNGKHFSAWYYAKASMALGKMRLLTDGSSEQRRRHLFFLRKLKRAFKGLLRGETLDDWFGPPLGPWENENEL